MTAVTAVRTGIVAGGALVGFLSASRSYDVDHPWLWGSDLAVTLAFALVAASAVPHAWRAAGLSAAVAGSWALAAWLPLTDFWHRAFLIHLLVLLILGVDALWPRRAGARLTIVLAYAVSVTPFIWSSDAAAAALALLLVVAAWVLRPRRTGRASRRAMAGMVALAVVLLAAAVLPAVAAIPQVLEVRAVGYALGLIVVAAIVASAVRPPSVGRAALDAVAELGAQPLDALRDRLAAALGDRSLEIGWWSADADRFLTHRGTQIVAPAAGAPRRGLIVESEGRPIAIVVGEIARLDERAVGDAILRASALAARHADLTARLRTATEQIEDSRRRLIGSAEAERLAIAADLEHQVGTPLRVLRADLARVAPERAIVRADHLVERALGELNAISRGLYPAVLEHGLAVALAELVRESSPAVVVRVEDEPDDPAIAQVAYFVCAEAVANALRHAECTNVIVEVARLGDDLWVSVSDDGRGGARIRPGAGLAGIADRVATAGGTFELIESSGGGPTVSARLPLAVESMRIGGSA